MILTDFVQHSAIIWLTTFTFFYYMGWLIIEHDTGERGARPDRFIVGIYALLAIPPSVGMVLWTEGSGLEILIGAGINIAYVLVFWKAKVWETIEIASLVLHNSRTSSGTHENRR